MALVRLNKHNFLYISVKIIEFLSIPISLDKLLQKTITKTMKLLALFSTITLAHVAMAKHFSAQYNAATIQNFYEYDLLRSSRDLIGWNRQFNAANQSKWVNPKDHKISINQQLQFLLKSGKFVSIAEILAALKKLRQHQIREQNARRARMIKRLGY